MSKYTTELRFICETNAGLVESEGYNSINEILERCRENIFNFDFPIFDETYRPVLEKKILKHYYTREIATETVGLWKHYLDMRLNEIMPYYNKLYKAELLEFNPFYDVDLTTDHLRHGGEQGNETGKIENETSNTSKTDTENIKDTDTTDKKVTSGTVTLDRDTTDTYESEGTREDTGTIQDSGTNSNTRTDNTTATSRDSGSDTSQNSKVDKNDKWDIYSDTPQGSLSNITLNDGAYLTNARHIIEDGSGSTNNTTTNYGKVNTTTNTGTVQDSGSDSNTRTLNTKTETNDSASATGTDDSTTTTNETINVTGTIDTTETGTASTTASGTNNTDTTKTHTINTTEDYLQHVKGKTAGASYSKLLMEYRDTFINIDMLVINELSDLFFGLW